jgi:IclR family pca regulon transcriptional regulator
LITILDNVKNHGYAVTRGEMIPELTSVAAPIRNKEGQVVAALNVAVNTEHYDPSATETVLIPAVISVAGRVSKALGYHP